MKIFNPLSILIVLFFLQIKPCPGQQKEFASGATRSINAGFISQTIVVDGHLDEEAWITSDSIFNFIQIEPNEGQPSRNKTVVKILYNKKYLYVGVYCYDSLGKEAIRVPDLQRDFNWRAHDTFAVCIDGFNDKRNSITFVTNPYGAQKDYLSFDDILFDGDWNGLWKVRTSINEQGWFAEFQIPWKTLRYPETKEEIRSWGINFLRLRRASNEISVWSPYPRSFGFNRMEFAGILNKIQPPPPSGNIQINPYALISVESTDRSDPKMNTITVKAGGDIKWALNSSTITDLTFNTDFAQAEADLQINSISRFSVLFPEKRQFFLENASLFGPGLIGNNEIGGDLQMLPFFSRRIGLSESGNPLPIDVGARITHRSLHKNIGIMAVHQGHYDSLPSTSFAIARYSQNLGKQNHLGGIATMKASADGYTNFVGGIDGFFRFGPTQSLNVMALKSWSSHPGGNGAGGYAQYVYTSDHLSAWWTEALITKDFNPEMGFISLTDVIETNPGLSANLRGKYLPMKKLIRSYQPSLTTSWFHRMSTGKLEGREIKISPVRFEMQDGSYLGGGLRLLYQNLSASFNPLGIPIDQGSYTYHRYYLNAGSDPSRIIFGVLNYEFGDYFNGSLQNINFSIGLNPVPQVSVNAGVDRNQFSHVGSNNLSPLISLYTIQGRLALNPRIQLTAIYQKNSQDNLDAFNFRFAWEYKPLSYIFLVFNSRENVNSEIGRFRDEKAIFKVSFLKQF